MKPQEATSNNPLAGDYVPPSPFHGKRRAIQVVTLLLLILIPVSGLFRIDLRAGNFVMLDRQIWWSDYYLMLGFWTMLATGAVMTYSTIGTVWCGWACPQNTFSELTNLLTFRFLGKRANVSIDSGKTRFAAAKNRPLNWALLGLSLLAVSGVLAIVPFFYFYPPDAVWHMMLFQPDGRLPKFMHYLYLVVVFAIFLNIAMIRHILCRYFCLYRMWQHIFKTRQTLHVEYDSGRSGECARCNYCSTSCFLDLDPTEFKIYDSCINCGECIDACNKLHQSEGTRGLLQFEFGEKHKANTWRDNVDELFSRLGWAGAIFLVGAALFVWGIVSYSPYNLVAYRSDRLVKAGAGDYMIQVSNKLYEPGEVALTVKGIPEGSYTLDKKEFSLGPAERMDVNLHVSSELPKGLHRIIVEARAQDGWLGRFGVEHYSEGN